MGDYTDTSDANYSNPDGSVSTVGVVGDTSNPDQSANNQGGALTQDAQQANNPGVIGWIENEFSAVTSPITTGISSVGKSLSDVASSAEQTVKNAASTLSGGISSVVTGATSALSSAGQSISNAASSAVNTIENVLIWGLVAVFGLIVLASLLIYHGESTGSLHTILAG